MEYWNNGVLELVSGVWWIWLIWWDVQVFRFDNYVNVWFCINSTHILSLRDNNFLACFFLQILHPYGMVIFD